MCVMAEILKEIALDEFGTLEGVTISYTIDPETHRVSYYFTRGQALGSARRPPASSLGPI